MLPTQALSLLEERYIGEKSLSDEKTLWLGEKLVRIDVRQYSLTWDCRRDRISRAFRWGRRRDDCTSSVLSVEEGL